MPVPSVKNRVSIITLCVCGVAASVMGCDASAVSWIDANAVSATRPLAEAAISPTSSTPGVRDTSTAALERQLLRDLLHEANATTALVTVMAEMPESR